jgi:hypothetical protein
MSRHLNICVTFQCFEIVTQIINKFYESFGNFNDNDLLRINYRRRIINRKENYWTLHIKKDKIEDFFNNFKKVNITNYLFNTKLKILNKYYENKDIKIIRHNKKDYFNVHYKDSFFIIKLDNLFDNCKIIYNKEYSSISFNINSNSKHIKFRNFINEIYNILDKFIKQNNLNMLINTNNKYNIKSYISNKTNIITDEKNKNIKLDTLSNILFTAIPIFWGPILTIKKNKIYVNFNIYEIYIKF